MLGVCIRRVQYCQFPKIIIIQVRFIDNAGDQMEDGGTK
jgi:hypothetical protein